MQHKKAVLFAVLAAVCYGLSAPFSKLFLDKLSPTFLAGLLYLGAGLGMLLLYIPSLRRSGREAHVTRKDLPYLTAMVLLDIAAPILLLWGLSLSTPATVSLLNNFEIAATAVIALVIFKEVVGKRLWAAIGLITLSCIVLSVDDFASLSFSKGAMLALLACLCWGAENNCTRQMSLKNPMEIVLIKGFGSGLGALLIAFVLGEAAWAPAAVLLALPLGAVAYGGSVYFYILAQRDLGAARTGAYYAFAPFIGVFLSFIVVGQPLKTNFVTAFVLMAAGAYLAATETHIHKHRHESLAHEHRHRHDDGHHIHSHPCPVKGSHSHFHTHDPIEHTHAHLPDLHHTHMH